MIKRFLSKKGQAILLIFIAAVLALAPMIALGVLSCVQPDFTAPLFRTTAGWVAIGTALVMEIVGYIAIRKITAIEV